jgi:hypothetical protein
MAIMHDCFNGDVLKGSDRQAHAVRILREALSIIHAVYPKFQSKLTFDYLQRNMGRYVTLTADRINAMMASLVVGSTSSIDVSNPFNFS